MKFTKRQLRKIIAEEISYVLSEAQIPDPTALKQQSVSTSQQKKDALGRISAGAEETSQERGIVNQLEAYFSKLAALPGVDLVRHRAILQRVLKTLETSIAKKHRGQKQGGQQ
jgi:hypothetical protein